MKSFHYNPVQFTVEVSQKALSCNYIMTSELWHILGYSSQYNEMLPSLWEKYGFDRYGVEYPGIDSVNNRIAVWYHLIELLTKGFIGHMEVNEANPLPLYYFDKSAGEYKKCLPDQRDGGTHINLYDLTWYFENIIGPGSSAKRVLLPAMLTAHQPDESKFPELDMLSLQQRAREWVEEYPTIKRLILYKARGSQQNGKKYLICAVEGVARQSDKDEIDSHKRYMNEHWESALHVIDYLADAYHDEHFDDRRIDKEWQWYTMDLNESLPYEFITTSACCNLYPVWTLGLKKGIDTREVSFVNFNSKIPRGEGAEGENLHKMRPSQSDKRTIQAIAIDIWKKHPNLGIKYMKQHPGIKNISAPYAGSRTLHDWLSEVAPTEIKKPGRRSAKHEEEQKRICSALGIDVNS